MGLNASKWAATSANPGPHRIGDLVRYVGAPNAGWPLDGAVGRVMRGPEPDGNGQFAYYVLFDTRCRRVPADHLRGRPLSRPSCLRGH